MTFQYMVAPARLEVRERRRIAISAMPSPRRTAAVVRPREQRKPRTARIERLVRRSGMKLECVWRGV